MPDNMGTIVAGVVAYIIPVASLYFTNKARIKESEHRQTVLEMTVEHLSEKVEHNIARLDGHDEQNRAMFAMVEQVKHLTIMIEEVKKDVKSLMIKGD